MDELFSHLETQIKALIQFSDRQRQTNHKLKQGKAMLVRDKEMLLDRYKGAITQIENMVKQLKSIEKKP